jgi:hypothetical protein
MNDETGACKKCHSEIALEAERCPECQYEPGSAVLGPIGKILGFLLLLGAMFQLLVGILLLITPLIGAPITSAILGAAIFIISGTIQALIASWLGGYGTKYAAEQPETSGDQKSFRDEIRDGKQRGEEWNTRIRNWIDELPASVFSASIAAGILLIFMSFIVVGTEIDLAGLTSEDLLGITLILSMTVLSFTVIADVGRVNRVYDANYRGWLYGLPAVLPLVGFIPALIWIWRRRSLETATDPTLGD